MAERAIKERPILFSGPMVRAILDGRKTETRRAIKHRENRWEVDACDEHPWPYWPCYVYGESEAIQMPCPYGEPGDLLWVRETWQDLRHRKDGCIAYRATWPDPLDCCWRPSIHMPKRFCRLWLRVTAVRVERLQEITEEQAYAEGVTIPGLMRWKPGPLTFESEDRNEGRTAFRELWNSINAKRGFGWGVNPWVWVVSFERIEEPGS